MVKLIKMIPIIMIMSQSVNRETLLMPSKMKTTYRKLLTKSVNPLMKKLLQRNLVLMVVKASVVNRVVLLVKIVVEVAAGAVVM